MEAINLIYNKETHAKLIVVDNEAAMASSMNFYSGSAVVTYGRESPQKRLLHKLFVSF